MPKTSYVTVTDMFCGAGGSSIGVRTAGAELRLGMNHWDLAIETHSTNFPDADHALCDVSMTAPRWYPPTTVLIASPSCTNHSLAKGVRRKHGQKTMFDCQCDDPGADRSRATAWDVVRFAEAHHYRIVIVENVVDFRAWELWPSWVDAMERLGYHFQAVYANSMFFHPTPQSRDRIYVIFWRKEQHQPDLDIRPSAWCPSCVQDIQAVQTWKNPKRPWGKYGPRNQYLYRCPHCGTEVTPYYHCAANAIDWTLPAPKIAERPKPLKEKTMERIRVGLEKYRGHNPFGERALAPVIATDHQALLAAPPPFIVSYYSGGGDISPIDDALPTIPTIARHGLVMPAAITPEECGFRMLQPHEIQSAMAFPDDYVIVGTGRQQIKQLGNAVTPPVVAELLKRCVATL